MTDFCNNNKFLPLRLSVYSYVNTGDHPFYGSVCCTTRDIEMLPDKKLDIIDKKGEKAGTLSINQFTMDMRPSLVEYLKEGWKINVSLAIDFSLSNFEITDYRSLHRVDEEGG